MNWLDIVILVVLAIFTFRGLKSGLIDSLVPLVAIILGVVLAGALQGTVADLLDFIDNESVAKIAAFAIILIGVFVVLSIIGKMVKVFLKVTFMGWIDRLGGAVFGFAMGWLICAAVVAVVARYAALPMDLPDADVMGFNVSIDEQLDLDGVRDAAYNTINDSEMAKLQLDSFPIVLDLLPGEFGDVKDFFEY